MQPLTVLPEGSVTTPAGFRAGVGGAGLRPGGEPDVAVLVSETACSCAGVFTRNRVRGAPVAYDETLLAERPGRIRGVVANAGCANACTGPDGLRGAAAMAEATEAALSLPPRSVLVLSTGPIGMPLPVAEVTGAVQVASGSVHERGGTDMARAIMTTDRHAKHTAISFESAGGTVSVGGVAKGSGMIHPNMATVLAVITTDAVVDPQQLSHVLHSVVDRTFNAITVNGATSTNDTAVLMANGASEIQIARDADGWKDFERAVELVARELAQSIVHDAGPSHRFVELTVAGASTEAAARSIGRQIGASAPVRQALGGSSPDWGRILAAAGAAEAPVDPSQLRLLAQVRADGGGPNGEWVVLAEAGTAVTDVETAEIFGAGPLAMRLEVGRGGAEATVWTCGLTSP